VKRVVEVALDIGTVYGRNGGVVGFSISLVL
jgi:hypothetical protein